MSNPRRVTTPVALLSYPHLFSPQEPFRNAKGEPQGEPKYGAVLVFDESADLSELKAAVAVAGEEKFGKTAFAKGLKSGRIRSPFRDDDDKGYPENSVFINAKSSDQPGIVGRYLDPDTEKPRVITDPSEIYPGCVVKASVTAFGYDVNGNKGIAFALNNVQKWDDGERLDSRIAAADEFTAEALSEASLDMDEDSGDESEGQQADSEGDDLSAFM